VRISHLKSLFGRLIIGKITVRELIDYCGNINHMDLYSINALGLAIDMQTHTDFVKLLLKKGASPQKCYMARDAMDLVMSMKPYHILFNHTITEECELRESLAPGI
jgi:hypothetical protein